MTDLLRCPFCGGKPLQNGPDNPGHEYWISCQSCQASSLMRSNVEAAQSAWNARTPSAGRSDLAGTNFVPWLRGLAENGGKGVVNNIDARCLGRIADEIERLQEAKRRALKLADERAIEANEMRALVKRGLDAINAAIQQTQAEQAGHDRTADKYCRTVEQWRKDARAALATVNDVQ